MKRLTSRRELKCGARKLKKYWEATTIQGAEVIFEATNKLAEYEDLEEDGLLLKLENKYDKIIIGTEIFVVIEGMIKEGNVCSVKENWNDYSGFCGEYYILGQYTGTVNYTDFGKTVFLSEKEAKEKIKM